MKAVLRVSQHNMTHYTRTPNSTTLACSCHGRESRVLHHHQFKWATSRSHPASNRFNTCEQMSILGLGSTTSLPRLSPQVSLCTENSEVLWCSKEEAHFVWMTNLWNSIAATLGKGMRPPFASAAWVQPWSKLLPNTNKPLGPFLIPCDPRIVSPLSAYNAAPPHPLFPTLPTPRSPTGDHHSADVSTFLSQPHTPWGSGSAISVDSPRWMWLRRR